MNLTDFLLARIAEDEQEFHDRRACQSGPWSRLLAECEAKRLLIERVGNPDWAGFRILAVPYADHPDFREEWRGSGKSRAERLGIAEDVRRIRESAERKMETLPDGV